MSTQVLRFNFGKRRPTLIIFSLLNSENNELITEELELELDNPWASDKKLK